MGFSIFLFLGRKTVVFPPLFALLAQFTFRASPICGMGVGWYMHGVHATNQCLHDEEMIGASAFLSFEWFIIGPPRSSFHRRCCRTISRSL